MSAMWAEVFSFPAVSRVDLRKRGTDFAFNLRASFPIIEVEEFGGGVTGFTDSIFRDFGITIFCTNWLERFFMNLFVFIK